MAYIDELQRYYKHLGKYERGTGYITGYVYEMCYLGVRRTTMSQDEVEGVVHIPRNMLARVRGNNNRNIRDVVEKAGITTLRVIGDDDRDQESLRKEGHVPIKLTGKRKCIESAVIMLENIMAKDKRPKESRKWLIDIEHQYEHQYDALVVKRIKLKSTLTKIPLNLKNMKRRAKLLDRIDEVEKELANIRISLQKNNVYNYKTR